jgi:hypothetical protein
VREVLAARSDRDFVSAGPRRRSGPSEPSAGGRLVAAALQRPGLVVGGLVMSAAAAAIIVNALSFQSARHPAPFFAKAERGAGSGRGSETVPVFPPVPPTRPPSADAPASPSQAAPRSAARDPIAEIIRGSETTGSAPAPARPVDVKAEPQRQVASAQRALAKLGYGPLKTDGIFGQETRQAIARFERDRRLAPTGELGPRTARELSAQSGIRVE